MKGLILTYALTYGGAVVSLLNPYWGLLIYVCFSIIKPEALWWYSVPQGGNYSRIVALALLTGWAMNGFGGLRFGRGGVVAGLLVAFWGWGAVCGVVGLDLDRSIVNLTALAKILLPFLAGITLIDSIDKLKQLAWVIMLSQGWVAYEMNNSYYSGWNMAHIMGFGGMDNNGVAISMVAGAGLAFFLGLNSEKLWQKLLAFVAAALMAHVTMFSMSRGGMLALCFTGAAAFVLIPKQPKHYWIFVVAVVAAWRLAGAAVLDRFLSAFIDGKERAGTAGTRLEFWGYCWDSMQQSPIFGVGPDCWNIRVKDYGRLGGVEAHSLWMQTGAEVGFPGLALLLGFYLVLMAKLWPLARMQIDESVWWLPGGARMVISSLIGFMVAAQFVTVDGLELPYYVAMLGAGVLKLAVLEEPATTIVSTHVLEKPYQLTTGLS